MNEKVKLGAAIGGGFAAVGGVWYAAGLPLSSAQQFVWFVLAAVSFGLLAFTFEVSRRNLLRIAGVILLLTGLIAGLGASSENAFGRSNVLSVLNRHGEYGIVCVGAGLLILIGGIDLSLGSVVGLSAIGFGWLMDKGVHPIAALPLVLVGGLVIGSIHGLLVTQLRVQAFLVTLCGMFVYRGLARTMTAGSTGMETVSQKWEEFREPLRHLRLWLTGIGLDERLSFPAQFVLMLALAAVAAVFLHRSAFGRYWYAIGYNEQAARYAGVNVWRHKVAVFCVCSVLAALAGIVRFLSAGSVAPSSEGQSYELYAITAAVLGGVSLRGGEGTAIGMVLGAMVLPVVNTLMNFTECPPAWEPWMIGLILLLGTVADEVIRRRSKVSG